MPITGLSGLVFTSATGAKSRVMPYPVRYLPISSDMARTASGPCSPTAAALGYRGREKAGFPARRATAPPSSSTPMSIGISEACCSSSTRVFSCDSPVMFLPKRTTPPTGYSARKAAMESETSVTPSASASSISSWERDSSSASGRTRNSCPTLSRRVMPDSGPSGCAVWAGSGDGVDTGAEDGAVQPASRQTVSPSAAARRTNETAIRFSSLPGHRLKSACIIPRVSAKENAGPRKTAQPLTGPCRQSQNHGQEFCHPA